MFWLFKKLKWRKNFKKAQKRLSSKSGVTVWTRWDKELTYRKNWLYSNKWMWYKNKKFSIFG